MSELIATEGKSMTVDFEDILRYNNDLANKVLLEPDSSLDAFRRAAYETLRSENAVYADRIRKVLTVRIRNIPDRIPLRKVDTSYLDKMLAVAGMVVRTSELRPLLVEGAFVCPSGHVTIQVQDNAVLRKPVKCETCEENRNLELENKLSRFVDFQILRVQELPEELPPGQLPQFFDVNVEGDITNTARPGDRVVLTGVVRAVPDYSPGQGRMRLFRSQIDCNHIEVIGKEPEHLQITKDDEALIRSIAANPDAYNKLINSMAPAILGHLAEREAILLLLAGGAPKALPDGTKLRGEINILLVGDPGVAKSEMLKFAAQVAPRGLFASGRGTTAAGLSAAVIREKNVLMLEAGVVVLADQGIASIDEFDKMRPEDRSALHEQMEQGTVTVAKGGIYATLNARTSILAATNPLLGKYNPYQNLTDNINLPIPLLSVGPEEQILIRENGAMRSVSMGEFVDSFYAPGSEGFPAYVESAKIQVASMDEALKLTWQPLKYVFRHKPEGPLYKVSFKGRDLVLTGGHCVYVFEDGRLAVKPTSQLGTDDYIAIARRLPSDGVARPRYQLLDYITLEGAFLHHVPAAVFKRLQNVPRHQEKRGILPASRQDELTEEERESVKISRRGSGFYIPSVVTVGRDLVRLIGYFVAEGSLVMSPGEGVYVVDFALNRLKDRALASDICRISKRLFHVAPTRTVSNNSLKLDIRSRVVAELLKNCFGLKSGAASKRIPDIVFNVADELRQEFISAYYAGDAGVTVSRELAGQLQQLFAQMGHVASTFHMEGGEKLFQGRTINTLPSYLIPIPKVGPQSNDIRTFPPIKRVVSAIKPVLGKLAPTDEYRKVMTPKHWHQIRNSTWVSKRIAKLAEARGNGTTAVKLARKYGTKGGGGDQGFVTKMMKEGVLQRDIIKHEAGRHFVYNMTAKGRTLLETIDHLEKVMIGDVAFARVDEIKVLDPGECPQYVYDLSVPGAQNFVADSAICHNSRFDLIFVIKDIPTPAEDEKLASHILAVHRKMGYNVPPPIEFKLMKKYIAYAKKITPILTKDAEERLKEYYLDLRRRGGEGTIGATPRTLESLIRLSTARAKILLRDKVLGEDALFAIALMNKMVEDVLTDTATKTKADFGVLLGRPAGERSKLTTALEVFKGLEGPDRKPVERRLFRDELVKSGKLGEDDAEKMIRTMFKEGIIYESKPGFFRRVGS